MKTVGIITSCRADWGIYLPVVRAISARSSLEPYLFVTGAHLCKQFGMTVNNIEADGFTVHERIEIMLSSDTPASVAKSMGLASIGFGDAYSRFKPDILLALGDRFEMHAAVSAALPFNIPVAHIHGGELSEGAIDECFRHSITKMSHLHFASTEQHGDRIISMGEQPWRVTVSGAPGLDNLRGFKPMNLGEIAGAYNINVSNEFALVTYHPVTLEYEQTGSQVNALLEALENCGLDIVFTYPNTDTCSQIIIEAVNNFVKQNPRAQMAVNLGTQGYFSLMNAAKVMVGNSSSGIIEAASFGLPVVNVGNRQKGRMRGPNVLQADCESKTIAKAIEQATSQEFFKKITNKQNPYGDGNSAKRIVDVLEKTTLDKNLLSKKFHDENNILR